MNNVQATFECSRCNKLFFAEGFKVDRLGKRLKTCLECNARSKGERERYKCPHGRQRESCRDCGGSSFCKHEHLRAQCRICSPKSSKASAALAHFRYHQKIPWWPYFVLTELPREHYDKKAAKLEASFTKLLEEGRVRQDEYDALMAKRKEWTPPPPKGPNELTDVELSEILRPIYTEMEAQKPPEVVV